MFRVLLLSLAVAGCATPAPEPIDARVDRVLAAAAAEAGFSGAVVLARDAAVVYRRGIGLANRELGVAFAPNTPSDGASLAKTFTAAAVWLLVAEGRLRADDPVQRYVPEYPHPQATIRHLLTHSAGLPDYPDFDRDFPPGVVRTTPALLAAVGSRATPPAFAPGSRFEYSSLGFDVAALAVERVAGKPFQAWLGERFFDRLGMTSTFVRPARLSDWNGVRTIGYRRRGDAWVVFDVFDDEGFHGGSNFYASALDLGRWAGAFATGRALPAAVVESGLRPSKLATGEVLGLSGLSWYCEATRTRCYYTGDLNGFYSVVYWDRERRESMVYVSNHTLAPWRRATLARELIDALAGRPTRHASATPLLPVADGQLDRIAGRYAAPTLGIVTIAVDAGRARLRVADGAEYRLYRVARDVFTVPGLDLWLAFSGADVPDTLHLRSVFVETAAPRLSALHG